jgi:hypothetical protein
MNRSTFLKDGAAGFRERKPLGVPFLAMSCTLATMIFDGLCREHGGVTLKKKKREPA